MIKRLLIGGFVVIFVLNLVFPAGLVSASYEGPRPLVINNSSLNDIEIPQEYLDIARELDVLFNHQSVGNNIISGLELLAEASPENYGINMHSGTDNIDVPAQWYVDNDGFGDLREGDNFNPVSKINAFNNIIRGLNGHEEFGSYVNVAFMKLCYVDNQGQVEDVWNLYRDTMISLEADYPDVTFVWFTMPLMTAGNDGNDWRGEFNTLVRNYVNENNRVLFDLADLESDGGVVMDVNGVESLNIVHTNDGGHLNANGAEIVARAYWVLMARLAGWDGEEMDNNEEEIVYTDIDNLEAGDMFRVDGMDMVYYIDSEMKRQFFYAPWVYESYFGDDYSDVNIIVDGIDLDAYFPPADIASVPPRPGSVLIINPATNNVYAIGLDNTLYRLMTEESAEILYGENWVDFVHDVPDYIISQYTLGEELDGTRPHPGQLVKTADSDAVYFVGRDDLLHEIDGDLTEILSDTVRTMPEEIIFSLDVSLETVTVEEITNIEWLNNFTEEEPELSPVSFDKDGAEYKSGGNGESNSFVEGDTLTIRWGKKYLSLGVPVITDSDDGVRCRIDGIDNRFANVYYQSGCNVEIIPSYYMDGEYTSLEAGLHNITLTVSNDISEDTFNFNLLVEENEAPQVFDQNLEVEDTEMLNITLEANDDVGVESVHVKKWPEHGQTIILDQYNFIYIPEDGYNGTDILTYSALDVDYMVSREATVNLSVHSNNPVELLELRSIILTEEDLSVYDDVYLDDYRTSYESHHEAPYTVQSGDQNFSFYYELDGITYGRPYVFLNYFKYVNDYDAHTKFEEEMDWATRNYDRELSLDGIVDGEYYCFVNDGNFINESSYHSCGFIYNNIFISISLDEVVSNVDGLLLELIGKVYTKLENELQRINLINNPPPPQQPIIQNGDFEDNAENEFISWISYGENHINIMSDEFGNDWAQIDSSEAGFAGIQQTDLQVEGGKTYLLSFDAKVDEGYSRYVLAIRGSVDGSTYSKNGDFEGIYNRLYAHKYADWAGDKRIFTVPEGFDPEVNRMSLIFSQKDGGVTNLDNVSIIELTDPDELILDGQMESLSANTIISWSNPIKTKVYDEEFDSRVMRVVTPEITDEAGNLKKSAAGIQWNDLQVEPGHTYTLSAIIRGEVGSFMPKLTITSNPNYNKQADFENNSLRFYAGNYSEPTEYTRTFTVPINFNPELNRFDFRFIVQNAKFGDSYIDGDFYLDQVSLKEINL